MNEPVEVIVHFCSSRVRPIRFLWRGRAHKIEAVRGRWTTLEGQARCHHWAVQADGVGACELAFDMNSMAWQINSVAIEN